MSNELNPPQTIMIPAVDEALCDLLVCDTLEDINKAINDIGFENGDHVFVYQLVGEHVICLSNPTLKKVKKVKKGKKNR